MKWPRAFRISVKHHYNQALNEVATGPGGIVRNGGNKFVRTNLLNEKRTNDLEQFQ
jgi:hypothetical protein